MEHLFCLLWKEGQGFLRFPGEQAGPEGCGGGKGCLLGKNTLVVVCALSSVGEGSHTAVYLFHGQQVFQAQDVVGGLKKR